MPGAHTGGMHVRSDVSSRRAAISPTEIATAHSTGALVHTPSAASSRRLSDRVLT